MKFENRRLAAIRYKLYRPKRQYNSIKRRRADDGAPSWALRSDTLAVLERSNLAKLMEIISPALKGRVDDKAEAARLFFVDFQRDCTLEEELDAAPAHLPPLNLDDDLPLAPLAQFSLPQQPVYQVQVPSKKKAVEEPEDGDRQPSGKRSRR
jgi:hypothetical protein